MRVEQHVNAAPATVWAVVTDLPRFAQVADIVSLERLDDGEDFTVGTRWRETRTMFGREATEEMWVTSVTPGRSYVTEAESHGTHYRSTLTITPAESGGATLTMDFVGTGTSLVTKVLGATVGRLFEGATRKALQSDLAAIAAAAEADEAPADEAGPNA